MFFRKASEVFFTMLGAMFLIEFYRSIKIEREKEEKELANGI